LIETPSSFSLGGLLSFFLPWRSFYFVSSGNLDRKHRKPMEARASYCEPKKSGKVAQIGNRRRELSDSL
jgi:hypothetical protein